ncbi:MAG: hypothetical protein A7316_03300 [Candidatus Altiarchaeales archaeon WOR_SM1_86-2]|nr:MAG: hypothetical protein A7316_03300 [Candidatus Altiarchaeales archaeon WOR_SM1_86-2]ODS40643.1 MAG: hypothetical protein A7315_08035 [Candidatus Altiarchaeales archaeon WOR_SM1_79]
MESKENVAEIIENLKSKNTKNINEGIKKIYALWEHYVDEKWNRREGNKATRALETLFGKLLILCGDKDWHIRYAALRGLKEMVISEVCRKQTDKTSSMLLKRIGDDNGNVRWTAVKLLSLLKIDYPDDLYVEVYLTLQEMEDKEENSKKKKSINQILDAMLCRRLDRLMEERGYVLVETFTPKSS